VGEKKIIIGAKTVLKTIADRKIFISILFTQCLKMKCIYYADIVCD